MKLTNSFPQWFATTSIARPLLLTKMSQLNNCAEIARQLRGLAPFSTKKQQPIVEKTKRVHFLNFHPHTVGEMIYVPNCDQNKSKITQANLNHAKIGANLGKLAKRAKKKARALNDALIREDMETERIMRQYNESMKTGNWKKND